MMSRCRHAWGNLSSKKGINLPDTKISLPALTEKDLVDLEFVIQQKLDGLLSRLCARQRTWSSSEIN
jgi:pyruvate kinase